MEQINLFELLNDIGSWSMHVGYVAFLALFGMAMLLLSVRLIDWRVRAPRFNLALPAQLSAPRLNLLIIGTLLVGSFTGYYALRPDADFNMYLADKAMTDKDYEAAVNAYEPLVRWGTRDMVVYNNIAICYLALGRDREAIENFHHVQALAPQTSVFIYTFCAQAHEHLGELAIARDHFQEAMRVAKTEKDRAFVTQRWEDMRSRHPELAK